MRITDWSNVKVDEATVLERVGTFHGAVDSPLWSCRCDCGELFTAPAVRIRKAFHKQHRTRLRCTTCTRSAVVAAAKKANYARNHKETPDVG